VTVDQTGQTHTRWQRVGPACMVPWAGTTAELQVVVHEGDAAVLINRRSQGSLAVPTLVDRWSEVSLPTHPPITVALVRYPQRKVTSLVFVDGACTTDGRSLESWRHADWHPMDRWEDAVVGYVAWSPPAILLFGLASVYAYWDGHGRNADGIVGGIVAGVLAGGWFAIAGNVLAPSLAANKTWPWQARGLLFAAILIGVPIAVLVVVFNTRFN
jgi:hypothetical protein